MSKAQSDEIRPNFYIEKIGIDQHFPKGENPREFYERIESAFESLQKSVAENENIALITYGGVIMALFHFLEGLDWIEDRQYIKVEKCSISVVNRMDGCWKLVLKSFFNY